MKLRRHLLAVLWTFLLPPLPVASATSPPGELHGTVEAARADQLVVRAEDGKVVPFRLDGATRYSPAAGTRSRPKLARGHHVIVHFRTEGSEFVAEHVVIQARAAATSPPAQHPEGHMQTDGADGQHPPPAPGGQGDPHAPSKPMADEHEMEMMATPLGGPFRSAAALGSGTSLLPATSPEYMRHREAGPWMLMAHGDLHAGFNRQGGPRGVRKVESQNWIMVMAERDLAGGRLGLRGMFSAEDWTTPRQGFPQLLQTGETLGGRPIVDAQHVHDLFMELAVAYARPLSDSVAIHLYGGPAAEPALGPTAFPHRPSTGANPAATLGHHFQDSTHITHGVITGGVTVSRVRVEGSLFRGAEPDEKRADLELGALDSWSGRIAFTPTRAWSVQVSHGRLKDPEASDPGDIDRTTASIVYTRSWRDGYWASSAIWGRNHEEHGNFNSYLLESALTFRRHHQLYARFELLDKDRLFERNIFDKPGLASCAVDAEECGHSVRVAAGTLGAVHDFVASEKWTLGVGADVTAYHIPSELEPVYGAGPVSVHAFVRIRPGRVEVSPSTTETHGAH